MKIPKELVEKIKREVWFNRVDQSYCPKNLVIIWYRKEDGKEITMCYNPATGIVGKDLSSIGIVEDGGKIRTIYENRECKSLYCKPITIDGHEALIVRTIYMPTSRIRKENLNSPGQRIWEGYSIPIIIFKEYEGGLFCNGQDYILIKTNSVVRDNIIKYMCDANSYRLNASETYYSALVRLCQFLGSNITRVNEGGQNVVYTIEEIREAFKIKMNSSYKSEKMQSREDLVEKEISGQKKDEDVLNVILNNKEVIKKLKSNAIKEIYNKITCSWYVGNYNQIALNVWIAEAGEAADIIRPVNLQSKNLLTNQDEMYLLIKNRYQANHYIPLEDLTREFVEVAEMDINGITISKGRVSYIVTTSPKGKTIVTQCFGTQIDNRSLPYCSDGSLIFLNTKEEYKSNLKYMVSDGLTSKKVLKMLNEQCVESMEKSNLKWITDWISRNGRTKLDTLLLSNNCIIPIPKQKNLADKLGITNKELKYINDLLEEKYGNDVKALTERYYSLNSETSLLMRSAYILKILYEDDVKSFDETRFKNMVKILKDRVRSGWYYRSNKEIFKCVEPNSVHAKLAALVNFGITIILKEDAKIKEAYYEVFSRYYNLDKKDIKNILKERMTDERARMVEQACDTLRYILRNYEIKIREGRETTETIRTSLRSIEDTYMLNRRLPEQRRLDIDVKDLLSSRASEYYHNMLVNMVNEHERLSKADKMKELLEIYSKTKKRRELWQFKDEEYSVILPNDPADELFKEGQTLNHCVNGYVESHVQGRTTIMFLRKNDNLNKPFYTIEVRDNKIIQIHGNHNCHLGLAPIEAVKTVMRWVKKNNFECEDRILLSTSPGYCDNGQRIPKPEID